MIDPITTEAVLRMFLDGLTVDEVLICLPQLVRSDIERIRNEKRQEERIRERLDLQMAPWAVK